MSLFFEDFDQWYEAYEIASPQAQYEILLEIIAEPIPLDYALETDIASILMDMQSLLEVHNLVEQALSFAATLQQQQSELYQREFYYFDNYPIRYALFSREPNQMEAALARYQQDPVNSIDQLLPVLDDLRLYDARNQAVEMSLVVYTPVATASRLLGGSEESFSAVVIADMLGQAYEILQQGNSVDWVQWGKAAAPFSFENTAELRQEVAHILTGQLISRSEFVDLWKKDPDAFSRQLSLRFNVTMADQHQLSFVCSQAIWSAVMSFFYERKLSKKQLSHPDHFFNFDFESLDRYVGHLMVGLFSSRQSMGFALIWGLPHVYDFLKAVAVIEDPVYESAITTVTKFQSLLLENWSGSLWRYSFVHRWGKPAHQTETAFEDEVKRFASTIDDAEPLSTEPIENTGWDERLTAFAENMAEKISKNPEVTLPGSSQRTGLNLPSTPNAAQPSANLPSLKTPKPRKSPLQEAQSLNKKAKGSNPKKPKGKGFG
jgi:hypothetical protein